MNTKQIESLSIVLVAACAVLLVTVGVALAERMWVDELTNSLTFYQANYPASNWDPYVDKLASIRDGVVRDDQQIVMVETDQFFKMLRTRAHGINDVAADELYNFALTLIPLDSQRSASITDVDIVPEMPMSIPDHTINTPYEGGPRCHEAGCDYWLDDVFDAGGG
jgi:hypothetical protein